MNRQEWIGYYIGDSPGYVGFGTFSDTASTGIMTSGGTHTIYPANRGDKTLSKVVMLCPACHSTMAQDHVGNCDHCGAPGGDMKLKRIRFTDE